MKEAVGVGGTTQKTAQFAYLSTLESVVGNLRDLGNLGLFKRVIKGMMLVLLSMYILKCCSRRTKKKTP